MGNRQAGSLQHQQQQSPQQQPHRKKRRLRGKADDSTNHLPPSTAAASTTADLIAPRIIAAAEPDVDADVNSEADADADSAKPELPKPLDEASGSASAAYMYKLLPPPDEEETAATTFGGLGGGLGGMKRSPAFDADVSGLLNKTDEQIRCLVTRTAACCVVNDDHMFPDSVTPCKVDGRLSDDYDVPYIDDDFFIFDEWYITDDKRWSCLRRAELPRLAECEDSRVTESAVTSVNVTPVHKQASSSRTFGRSVRLFQLCCGRGQPRRS